MKRSMVLTAAALLVVMVPSFALSGGKVRKVEKSFDLKMGGTLGIDIEETKDWKKKHGQKMKYIYGTGKVGGGKNLIRIRTINGDVHINEE